jgi:hypothetical protein
MDLLKTQSQTIIFNTSGAPFKGWLLLSEYERARVTSLLQARSIARRTLSGPKVVLVSLEAFPQP